MNDDKPKLVSPQTGFKGMTELHNATYCGNIDSLKKCLSSGADPNHKSEYRGYTSLHWLLDMLASDGPREEMMKILIEAGADVNAVADDGYESTPVILAKEAMTEDSDHFVSLLIRHGAKPEK